MAKNPLLRTVWIAFRFLVFGVFGFIVMFFAFVMSLDRRISFHHVKGYLAALGLIAVCGLGSLMTLFGVGEWGRWGYLFVFLSIPVSLLFLFLTPNAGEEAWVAVPALASVGTSIIVRVYYARRKKHQLSNDAW